MKPYTAILLVLTFLFPTAAMAGPDNLRQVDEGYWLSGELALEDIDTLEAHGIDFVVSLSTLSPEVVAELDRRGIDRIKVRFGKNFPTADRFRSVYDHPANKTLVHCLYGADRTGVFVAYLLHVRHGLDLDEAILSMLYPHPRDLAVAVNALEERGYDVTDDEIEDWFARYSGVRNGGVGGLKFPHADYVEMLYSTFTAVDAAYTERAATTAAQLGTIGQRDVPALRNVSQLAHETQHNDDGVQTAATAETERDSRREDGTL